MVADGDDPDDRHLLFGTEGGYVEKWDSAANSDDSTAIDARCLYGPFTGPETTRELKIRDLTGVLSDNQGGCNYEFFVNDRPDVIPAVPAKAGKFSSGRNQRQPVRARGMSVWMKVRNADVNSRFAVEYISSHYEFGSRMRVRS
jgi:hypothetical protein